MTDFIDSIIAYHCAPAVKGIKVSNLVALQAISGSLVEPVDTYNAMYNKWGLYFYSLCDCKKRRLLLVYRKRSLEAYLRLPKNQAFLQAYGYDQQSSLQEMLKRLAERLQEDCSFPHEIGLFLGYPLADVEGFIAHRGANYLLSGEWKVYSSVAFAKKMFHRYSLCRRECQIALAEGKTLRELIKHTA